MRRGISGVIVTVPTVTIVTDLTVGTGRFNFARRVIGTLTGIAASLSITATGFLVEESGHAIGFLSMAAVAALVAFLLWFFLPETKPQQYLD